MVDPIHSDSSAPWQQSIYDQLHKLANLALANESPGHSLQTTLVANDAYLRLFQQRNFDPSDTTQVKAIGANIIRRLLVDYARQRKAKKRGGTAGRGFSLRNSESDYANTMSMIELSDALTVLAGENPRAAQVVEMRFFGGLTIKEIANTLQVSERSVSYDWRFAKAWLSHALQNPNSVYSENR